MNRMNSGLEILVWFLVMVMAAGTFEASTAGVLDEVKNSAGISDVYSDAGRR